MADDVVKLYLELDSKQAQAQAQKFIKKLESDFKRLSRQLSKALGDGVADGKQSNEVKKLRQELDRLEKELKDVKNASDGAGKGLGRIGISLSTISKVVGAIGLARLAIGFKNLANEAFNVSAELENTRNVIAALVARDAVQTGDFDDFATALANTSDRAKELLGFVKETARTSPFTRETVQSVIQTSLAFGSTVEEARRLTSALVDFGAATGATQDRLQGVALALGQVASKEGRAFGQELLQLSERGVNVSRVLESIGATSDDVSKGLVSSAEFINAAITQIETDFAGFAATTTDNLLALQSTFETLRKDLLEEFFAPSFRELAPLFADISANIDDLIPAIRDAGESFASFINTIIKETPDAVLILDTLANSFNKFEDALSSSTFRNLVSNVIALFGGFERQTQNLIQNNIRSAESFEDIQIELQKIIDLQDEIRLVDVFGEDLLPKAAEETAKALALQADSVEDFILLLREFEDFRIAQGGREELSPLSVTGEDIQAQVAFFEVTTQAAEAAAKLEAEERKLAETRNLAKREQIERNEVEETALRQRGEIVEATKLQLAVERELLIELVKNTAEVDKNAQVIFDQAEAAGASGEQLRQLALELGILTPEQIAAQQAQVELTAALIAGTVSTPEYIAQVAELNAVLAGTASNTASAASSVNALNAAFSKAISPTRRRGGGRDTTAQDALKEQADAIEEQAKAIENATKGFADVVLEIVKVEEQLASAREELDKATSEGASEEDLENLRTKISELEDGTSDWESSLFDLTQQAGASIDTLAALGVATGQFTEEQARAAIATLNRQRGLQAIAKSLAEGTLSTEDAVEAAKELNRQLQEGEDVDLTAFDIDVTQVDTEAVPALLRETAQAAREAAEALTKIAGALGGVADGSETLSQAILKQTATQAINKAETLDQTLAALQLAVAFGTITKEVGDQLAQIALLDEVKKEGILTDEQFAEALRLVADEGISVEDAMIRVGASIEELPEELQIEIETNKDEVLSDIAAIGDALDALERERIIRLRVEREDITVTGGGAGALPTPAGALPLPEDADFDGQEGGFTGRGNVNDIAGIVHREELVVPANVLRGGVPAIAAFAASNVPNLRSDMLSVSGRSPVQNAVVPNVTNISNSTTGDTITNSNSSERGGDTINLFGVPAERIARSAFSTEFAKRQNRTMKRSNESAF